MIRAYQFEPKKSSASKAQTPSSAGANDDDEPQQPQEGGRSERLQDATWCHCGQCGIMATATECVCCQELPAVRRMGVRCITEHGQFEHICLLPHVLASVLVMMRHVSATAMEDPISNRSYRLCAYRLFTSWIHGRLGAGFRLVIPACVVLKIRNQFPSDDGTYTGFMESENTPWPW